MENNESKRILFADWCSWRAYMEKAVVDFAKGFVSILYAILVGIATIIYKVSVFIKRLVLKYPVYSLALLCTVIAFCWFMTFVRLTHKTRTYEAQRDSIGYEKMKIEQALDGDTIIIGKRK